VVDFITADKKVYGVALVCRVFKAHGVKIASSTYYVHVKRLPSRRELSDADWCEVIEVVFLDPFKGRSVAGYTKVWHPLKRDGHQIVRCTVERLMRRLGLKGVRRDGKRVITTRADGSVLHPPHGLIVTSSRLNRTSYG
jgi:putative transposase